MNSAPGYGFTAPIVWYPVVVMPGGNAPSRPVARSNAPPVAAFVKLKSTPAALVKGSSESVTKLRMLLAVKLLLAVVLLKLAQLNNVAESLAAWSVNPSAPTAVWLTDTQLTKVASTLVLPPPLNPCLPLP